MTTPDHKAKWGHILRSDDKKAPLTLRFHTISRMKDLGSHITMYAALASKVNVEAPLSSPNLKWQTKQQTQFNDAVLITQRLMDMMGLALTVLGWHYCCIGCDWIGWRWLAGLGILWDMGLECFGED